MLKAYKIKWTDEYKDFCQFVVAENGNLALSQVGFSPSCSWDNVRVFELSGEQKAIAFANDEEY